MKDLLIKIGNKHDYIMKIILIFIAIFSIVILFPKEGKFKYEYQKGKRWMHADLYAPFDFGIYKTQEELDEDIKYVLNNIKIYYRIDTTIKQLVIKQYINKIDNYILDKNINEGERNKKKNNYYTIGYRIIDTLYSLGVFPSDINDVKKNKSNPIVLIIGNTAREVKRNEIISVDILNEKIHELYGKIVNNDMTFLERNDSIFITTTIFELIQPNVNYDETITEKLKNDELSNISLTRGLIKKGEKIISQGEIINNEKYQLLESLKKEYEEQSGNLYKYNNVVLGYILLVFTGIFALFLFLKEFRKDIFAENKKIFFLIMCIFLDVLGARLIMNLENINLYVFPFCILPIMIRIFYDTRLAFYVHVIAILFIGFMAPNSYEFVLIQIITGMIAIISIRTVRHRAQLFTAALVIFIMYIISYTAISVIKEGNFSLIDQDNYKWFAVNSMLTLFAYPFLYIFEKTFGFTSEVTLLELCDTNNKLLRTLAEKAPGTFQHSLQVANLAEDAIYEIGGNTLLVRAGALYHDIGKMLMPMYFIENQTTGFNPHVELSFEDSAKVIISHVIQGVELAKKRKLPDIVIDFIRTHHGTSVVHYFYKSYLNDFPDKEVDLADFSYPGPIPYSKETAVLMMADSVEASSRSLKVTTPEAIDKLVEDIINKQLENNQFINADITLNDITKIKKIFKKKLINMYHGRIEYPK